MKRKLKEWKNHVKKTDEQVKRIIYKQFRSEGKIVYIQSYKHQTILEKPFF